MFFSYSETLSAVSLPRCSLQLMILIAGMYAAVAEPASGSDTFELNWYTIDGGGGLSSAGGFEIRGTIGQTDTRVISGGEFTIKGGFWPENDLSVENVRIFGDDFETLTPTAE